MIPAMPMSAVRTATMGRTSPPLSASIWMPEKRPLKDKSSSEIPIQGAGGNNMNTDIVIVGAGPAGIFTAIEMIRRGSRKAYHHRGKRTAD